MKQELAKQILAWYGFRLERSPEEIEKLANILVGDKARHPDEMRRIGIESGSQIACRAEFPWNDK